ncbi:hypothetical protein EV360DRAFT_57528 [Lentinula raphanica]|nr:hypothetical protein EV360DRAFT_57528 [Lentinula raphanica]
MSSSTDVLEEFRRHYHAFASTVQQVAHDSTDVFHLRLLLEDLEEFSHLAFQVCDLSSIKLVSQSVIDPDFLRWASTHRTNTGIADFLGVSRRTVRRALLSYNIVTPGTVPFEDQELVSEENTDQLLDPNIILPSHFHPDIETAASSIQTSSSSNRHSNLSNNALDSLVQLLRVHYPRAGIQILHGMLRRLGHIIPYESIRHSLLRVDPVHRVFDRIRIRRRRYSVPGPNSLWHHDGHHREGKSFCSYIG